MSWEDDRAEAEYADYLLDQEMEPLKDELDTLKAQLSKAVECINKIAIIDTKKGCCECGSYDRDVVVLMAIDFLKSIEGDKGLNETLKQIKYIEGDK